MVTKKKKTGKAKVNKGAKGPGKGPQLNPGDFGDDATVAELLVGSESTAGNGIASVEESLISGAIEASLQSSRELQQKKVEEQAKEQEMELANEDSLDFMDDQELQSFADGSNSTVVCPHVKKAVNILNLRRTLAKLDDWDHCHGCRLLDIKVRKVVERMDPAFARLALSELGDSKEALSLESLWMCLSCGDINCGRAIKEHAISHYDTEKKEHPLIINLASMECWCYECDDQIVPAQGRNPIVQECQSVITKILQSHLAKARAASIALARKNKGALIEAAPKAKIFAPGLQNLGNTCFFNSVVQVLTETKSLKTILTTPDNAHVPVSLSATTDSGLGPLTTTFKDFLHTMWKQSGGFVTPRDLFTQIAKKWKVFRGMKEQDSQELMRFLFDGIKEEELDLIKKRQGTEHTPKDPTKYAPFIESCFAGKLVSVIVCDACKKVSSGGSLKDRLLAQSKASSLKASFTTVDDSDHIPESEKGSEAHLQHVEKLLKNVGHSNPDKLSIERSLNQFTSVDFLEGENKFACENCYKILKSTKSGQSSKQDQTEMEGIQDGNKETVKDDSSDSEESDQDTGAHSSKASKVAPTESKHILRQAYKRYLVSSLPPTLVLHLKRFEQTGLRPRKIEDQVDIPVELDMSPYVIPSNELFEEGDAGSECVVQDATSTKYRLYGVVVHAGSLATGHYTNYVLSSKVELAPIDKKDATVSSSTLGMPDIPLAAMLEMQAKSKKKGRGKKGSGGQQQQQQHQPQQPVKEEAPVVVETKEDRQWIHCGDLNVRMATLEEVLDSRPYLLFYEHRLYLYNNFSYHLETPKEPPVMTRTRTGDYKDITNPNRERRQSKGSISDARAIPKKLGAGAGNWGVPGSEREENVASSNMTSSSSPPENKINVIDADTFARLQNGDTAAHSNDSNEASSSSGQTS
ncbi:Ubiquitin carboxyl-terminal hydrolase 16 [Podila horticola]|nr:Ubiquitin carboxyl-terminal hydrolase 16 [Podila horticola]